MRTDPYERADVTSNTYWDWVLYHGFMLMATQAIAGQFVETFVEFPPAQSAASFTIDKALEKMHEAASGALH